MRPQTSLPPARRRARQPAGVPLPHIVALLDQELVYPFPDTSHNGLQVQNSGAIHKICTGVDASLPFLEQAAARGANLLVCHHGLSWGDSLKHITDLNYQRLKMLLEHDLALYASHLPLDAHPRYGNNVCLARALGLRQLRPWGVYKGTKIGVRGQLPAPVPLVQFVQRVESVVHNKAQVMAFGPAQVRTVAMVVGGGALGLDRVAADGIDVYLSGEAGLQQYNLAQDTGVNAIFAGHYATESLGVQALGALLQRQFRLPVEHIDLAIPY